MSGPWINGPLVDPGAIGITGGTVTGTNAAYVLSRSSIPFIFAGTGSMGNNGALTLGTALLVTYASGAYVWLPAGAIAAGVPAAAAWYWCVFSSTTLGTVYNSTYTSGTPAVGVQTAFVTTGPGAFTGSTSEVFGPIITVPAGAIGANGRLRTRMNVAFTNSAGTKTPAIRFSGTGGTSFYSEALTTQQGVQVTLELGNRGSQAVQDQQWTSLEDTTGGAAGPNARLRQGGQGAIDTSVVTTIVISATRNTATDNAVLGSYEHEIAYAA